MPDIEADVFDMLIEADEGESAPAHRVARAEQCRTACLLTLTCADWKRQRDGVGEEVRPQHSLLTPRARFILPHRTSDCPTNLCLLFAHFSICICCSHLHYAFEGLKERANTKVDELIVSISFSYDRCTSYGSPLHSVTSPFTHAHPTRA
eukprot:6186881-Pleurochrysis_carterae.AAC.2